MAKTIMAMLFTLLFIGAAQELAAGTKTAPQREVTVTNTTEFLQSIAPNTRIIILEDEYEPIVLSGIEEGELSRYCSFEEVYMGRQLLIKGADNLSIIGGKHAQSYFISPYSYANVIHFEDCDGLTLQNLNCGHDIEGYCTGGVLAFNTCNDVRIENCDLWGCGIEGLTIYDSSRFTCVNTTIRDCSYGIMTIQNSHDIRFENCMMRNNREFDLINVTASQKIRFENCAIWDNHCSGGAFASYLVQARDSDIRFSRCAIFNNSFEDISSDATVKFLNSVVFNNNPAAEDY